MCRHSIVISRSCALFFFLLVALVAESPFAQERPITGRVTAVGDGDTFTMNLADGRDVRVRLRGIDAVESKQTCTASGQSYPCGERAGAELRRIIQGKTLTCEPEGGMSYGRMVAICRVGPTDVNAHMVRSGWAVAYTRYTSQYADEEDTARRENKGLWRGQFDLPECYRNKGMRGCPCVLPNCNHREIMRD